MASGGGRALTIDEKSNTKEENELLLEINSYDNEDESLQILVKNLFSLYSLFLIKHVDFLMFLMLH